MKINNNNNNNNIILLLLLAVISIAIGSPISELNLKSNKFEKIVVFGDSYSDNGNSFLLSNKTWPITIGGRYTNGLVWSEYLSQLYNATLVDLAYGGATADNDFIKGYAGQHFDLLVPGIKQQVDEYVLKHSKENKSESTLFVVWDAGNDYINTNYSLDTKVLIKTIISSINTLFTKGGATNYLVPDIPDLTTAPLSRNLPGLKTIIPNVVKLHNSELKIALDDFEKTNQGVKIYRFQTAEWFSEITSPDNKIITELGITNIVDPCSNLYAIPPIVCGNPDEYYFWDSVHPTTKIHNLFANYVFELLK